MQSEDKPGGLQLEEKSPKSPAAASKDAKEVNERSADEPGSAKSRKTSSSTRPPIGPVRGPARTPSLVSAGR